jgi:hypothetical protein
MRFLNFDELIPRARGEHGAFRMRARCRVGDGAWRSGRVDVAGVADAGVDT